MGGAHFCWKDLVYHPPICIYKLTKRYIYNKYRKKNILHHLQEINATFFGYVNWWKVDQTMLLKIITWLLVAGDGNASSNKCLGYIYRWILSVFDVFRSPLLAYFFGDILSALASPSRLWARADLPALAGPKTAHPSSLQLLSWAVSITTYYVPFGVILILFRYIHTRWGCAPKPFTKWLSCYYSDQRNNKEVTMEWWCQWSFHKYDLLNLSIF